VWGSPRPARLGWTCGRPSERGRPSCPGHRPGGSRVQAPHPRRRGLLPSSRRRRSGSGARVRIGSAAGTLVQGSWSWSWSLWVLEADVVAAGTVTTTPNPETKASSPMSSPDAARRLATRCYYMCSLELCYFKACTKLIYLILVTCSYLV